MKKASTLAAIAVLILLIVVLLGANSIRRSSHIHLPGEEELEDPDVSQADGSAIRQVSVTPETVQRAIGTLQRPERYARTVTVEQLWSGGSGVYTSTVSVRDGWTRVDTQLPGGTLRHSLTDGKTTYIWYGTETAYYTGAAGDISADAEQAIPTYEDVLACDTEQILRADYRSYGETACIYVETALTDRATLCYWVSVASGLLTAAEKYEGDTLVYRMTAAESAGEPAAELFVLPDGTALLSGET
ncbi:MAG: hypothetical protein ACI3WR_02635 [Oscillospiraceae bacterium]